ncbi:serine/threonine protein kinase [Stanieria cyanosphaera PCC 7437]|uniref:non-specific serine/threonine protein kinase n=1 Tax=Stanieria cyanosphaera (strain ATCC 29371 / PCC 7437) TaxID=111780 RepID=K9XNS0_STAC7|nr:serine/threonine-protein kinase [Stanieria cyanosphaera]AFZ33729.1 serine/threonine protein kinase [Stanieria cyanosphaera PCC 7437]
MSNSIVGKEEIPFGTIIDNRYLIQKILGQGGLGRTYLAFDTHRFNEPCVLKEFAPFGSGQYDLEKSRELFKREAKILHQIIHPQIPKFLACFEGQGRLFLVQEYVNGQTYSALLKQRRQQGTSFAEPEVIQWLMNLLPVLEYIHQRGIIHRDISPDNIMKPNGEELPVLIDFGVGKLTNISLLEEQTSSHHQSYVGKMSFVGKIGYAPREQISMGRCSPSSDLYSLGVTAIVLLTGREPTMLLDQYSLEWQWRNYVTVSSAFGKILDKMTADRPLQRYQSVQEVLLNLQQLNHGQPLTFPTSSPSQINPQPIPLQNEDTIIVSSASTPVSPRSSASFHSVEETRLVENIKPSTSSPQSSAQPLPLIEETKLVNDWSPSNSSTNPLEETMIVNSTQSDQRRLSNQPQNPQETSISSSRANSTPVASLDPKFIKRCQQDLAYCIGPMASLIVEEILIQYAPRSPEALIDALAEQIPDAQQAIQFKRKLLS